MSSTFPGTLDVFSNPAAGSVLTTPSHAGQHSDANDAIEAIETVLGVTTGTNVLKNFVVGKFAVHTTGGTLANGLLGTSTITGGTASAITITSGTLSGALVGTSQITGGSIATVVIGTPTITGGSWSTGTITGAVVGTPSITGGTISAALIGTSTITGGTVNPASFSIVGTAGATGTAIYVKTITGGTAATWGTIAVVKGLVITIN
jgi:hypothetical protein